MLKKLSWDKILIVFGSVLTTFAFQIKLDFAADGTVLHFTKSFHEYSIIPLCLVIIFFFFYELVLKMSESEDRKNFVCCLIPAIMFSLFYLMGYSYEQTSSWDLVVNSNHFQYIKAFIAFMGYSVFFYFCIVFLFCKLDAYDIFSERQGSKTGIVSRYFEHLNKRPFIISFITLLVVYIPYVIASYPAIFMGDTAIQIVQAYPECENFAPYYTKNHVLKEGVYLNNHHPIAHTLLIHIFVCAGEIFSSHNVGIFMYGLLQLMFMLAAIAYLIKFLIELNISKKLVCLALFYYFFSRRIQNYMFLITKDVIFAAFFLFFIVSLFQIFIDGKKRYYVIFGISMLGIILFRNDGKYMLIASLAIIGILCRRFRKQMLMCTVLVCLFGIVFFNIILPTFHIMRGSTREMLSVPFQQTARYLRESSTPITPKEKEAISAILDYDAITTKYNPELSDPVKETFNENATSEELKEYFKVYISMFFKHPSHYIQATINNYYYYFYPGSKFTVHYTYAGSSNFMNATNKRCEAVGMDFSHPKSLEKYRNTYEKVVENIAKLPIIAILLSPATYTWSLILIIFYCIRKKNKKAVTVTIPFCIQLLICLVGPTNGWHFRYMFSIAVCMPAIVLLCLYYIKSEKIGYF